MSNSSKKNNSELDSPSGGNTPDWMRMAASETGGNSSLTEENTPDWLKSIQSGQPAGKRPKPTTDPFAGMSDLERLLAEEGIDLGAVEEDSPEGLEGMSARDWLISTSDDELVRNRKGRGEEIDLSMPQTSAAAADSSAAASEDDDPYAGMSDLDRLLAEEGIDLGGIKETRPAGSEKMSARDWLISTSDDELVRNSGKNSAVLDLSLPPNMASTTKTPPPTASKGTATAKPTPPPTPAKSAPVAAKTTPPPSKPIVAAIEDDPYAGMSDLDRLLMEEGISMEAVKDNRPTESQGMSARDFLMSTSEDELIRKRVGRKEDVDLSLANTPTKAAPVAAKQVEAELPDWLAETEDEPAETPFTADGSTISPEDDLMIDSDDLPDWLKADDEETAAPATMPSNFAMAQSDEDDELPDWLMADDNEAEPATPQTKLAAMAASDEDDELPDWLMADAKEETPAPATPQAKLAAMAASDEDDELPDWLMADAKEETPAPATPQAKLAAMAASDEDDELPDWLMADAKEETPEPATPQAKLAAMAASDEDDELPDWLMADDEAEAAAPTTTAPAHSFAQDTSDEDDELPDWLKPNAAENEVVTLGQPVAASQGLSDEDDELPDWLMADDEAAETATPTPSAAQLKQAAAEDDLMVDEDNLPDWLKADDEAEITPALPKNALTPSNEDSFNEGDLPDWLMGDDEAEDTVAAPAPTFSQPTTAKDEFVDEDELPDWLMGDNEAEVATPAPTFSQPTTAKDELIDEDELPDWLMGDGEADDEAETFTSVAVPTVALATAAVADNLIDEDNLPDWLMGDDSDEEEISTSSNLASTEDDLAVPDDLPDWLREVSNDVNEPIIATAPSDSNDEYEDEAESDDLPDWLQDVSDDDDSPIMAEMELEPLLDASTSESDDLPDWLREVKESDEAIIQPVVATSTSESEAEVDQNNLPDWLQDIQEETTAVATPPADDPYAGMSDLERLLAEEGIDMSGMADERPKESQGMSARDYLLSISDDEMLRKKAGQTQEVDLTGHTAPQKMAEPIIDEPTEIAAPAWLETEAESETIDFAAMLAAEEEQELVADEIGDSADLPSWLQEAQESERGSIEEESFEETASPTFATIAAATIGATIAATTASAALVEEPDDSVEFEPPVEFEPSVEVETKAAPIPVAAVEPTKAAPPARTIPIKPVTVYQGELPAWLRKLREADQRAQELTQISPMYVPVPIPTSAPILVAQAMMAAAPMGMTTQTQPVMGAATSTPSRAEPDEAAMKQLKQAQAAKAQGDLNQAFQAYQALISRGIYLDAVITDIQEVVKNDPKNSKGYQLMGDAMVLDGRLQSALEAYRHGLAAL